MSAVHDALDTVVAGHDLTQEAAQRCFGAMVDGSATSAEIAAFLTALSDKGETSTELTAAVRAIRARATRIECAGPLVDTCGTGGDKLGTFNISTAAAFVAAAAGLRVAKHGNRAVSGSVGAADVLEAAGACIEMPPEAAAKALERAGFCFLFAPLYHPALKHVGPVRRELKFPTVFNLAGPLCNPAGATRQVLGVFAHDRLTVVAEALIELGTEHALVVHGDEGVDEITPTGPTQVVEVRTGSMTKYEIDPRALAVAPCRLADLRGGDAAANARMLREVLSGARGPRLEAVALNAGAALYVGGCAPTFAAGVEGARAILASGSARERLETFVEVSRESAA